MEFFTIKDSVAKELEKYNYVVFAILFGSFAEGRSTSISDVDLGLYTDKDITLLEVGLIVANLEKILKKKIDIVMLNDFYKKNPVLAFEIVSKGQRILCRNQERFIEFKKNTLRYYLDTAHLRHIIDESFKKRLSEKRLGERNYVGTA